MGGDEVTGPGSGCGAGAPAVAVRPPTRRRWYSGTIGPTLVVCGVFVVMLGGIFTVTPPVIPSPHEMPGLPDGFAVAGTAGSCGSGGCRREWTVVGPTGMSPDQVVSALDLSPETCGGHGFLDVKPECTGVVRIGDDVRMYVEVREAL